MNVFEAGFGSVAVVIVAWRDARRDAGVRMAEEALAERQEGHSFFQSIFFSRVRRRFRRSDQMVLGGLVRYDYRNESGHSYPNLFELSWECS